MAKASENRAASLTVDDGSRRYEILNGFGEVVGEFTLTPTDLGIYERYARMREEIGQIVKPLEALGDGADLARLTEATEAVRDRLFAAINRMFGGDVADKLFGRLHPFTPVNGRFYFDRVLEAVGAQIEAVFESEAAQFGAHVARYARRARGAGKDGARPAEKDGTDPAGAAR